MTRLFFAGLIAIAQLLGAAMASPSRAETASFEADVGQTGGYGRKTAVPANQWHTLPVEFGGARFNVVFNGKPLFAVEDATFPQAGMVGLWTKADSVTAFSGLTYDERR
jgi:hypothetical protein